MLGWDIAEACSAILLYNMTAKSREAVELFVCENGTNPILPLPAVTSGDFSLLFTAPQLAMSGSHRLFLLGELSKLGAISPARIEKMKVEEDLGGSGSGSLDLIGQADELVDMVWIWIDAQEISRKETRCKIGQDGRATMEIAWADDNLFETTICSS